MAKHTIFLALIYVLLCGCEPKPPAPAETPAPKPKRQVEEKGPPLISKLRYLKDESKAWLIAPGFVGQRGAMPFKYEDTSGLKNRAAAAEPIWPGELFFADGPAKGRFKYLGIDEREELNPAINVEERITYALVEDQKPNKKGMVYELPSPMTQRNRPKHIQYDRSAVLMLEPMRKGDKLMTVEENTRFALPFDAKTKDYLLKSVTPYEIVVEYTDAKGKRTEVTIKKGQLPVMSGDEA